MDVQGMFDLVYNVSGTISIIGLIVIVILFMIAKIKNSYIKITIEIIS